MRYKLVFETVTSDKLHKYYNADPRFYSNVKLTATPDEVAEEDWHEVSRESANREGILGQYNTLKRWSKDSTELIRNVRLLYSDDPEWKEYVE